MISADLWLVVFRRLEDLAPIGSLALEDTACIMQAMRQNVEIGVAPGNQRAVVPDNTVTIIERKHGKPGSLGPITDKQT